MVKSSGLPYPSPAGQRLVKMPFPVILGVVHKTEEAALKEVGWLNNHMQDKERKGQKYARKRRRQAL